jgi:1-acyl-sn-glycerol-3-phosphate acyltransferase
MLRCLFFYGGMTTIVLTNYIYFRFMNLINKNNKYHFRKVYFWSALVFLNLCKTINYNFHNDSIDISKNNTIFVCNHISLIDSLIIISYFYKCVNNFEKINMIGSYRFFKYPVVGYIFKNLGIIPVQFSNNTINCDTYNKSSVDQMMNDSINCLSKGESLLILPEGKLNVNPKKMNEIKCGAFNLHKQTNVPITILGMRGNDSVWGAFDHPNGSGKIEMKCLKSNVYYDNVDDYKNDVRNTIETFVNEEN